MHVLAALIVVLLLALALGNPRSTLALYALLDGLARVGLVVLALLIGGLVLAAVITGIVAAR